MLSIHIVSRPVTGRQSLGEKRVQRGKENCNKRAGRQHKIVFRQNFHHQTIQGE